MKRICFALLAFIAGNFNCLFGQGIIYTINGIKAGTPTYLDSILFENLDNGTRFLAADLPNQLSYEINLTSLELISSINSYDLLEESLKIIISIPGEVGIQICNNRIDHTTITLCNISGQQLLNKYLPVLEPGDIISLQIPDPGIYVLNINTLYGIKSFKVSGSTGNLNSALGIVHSGSSVHAGINSPIETSIKRTFDANHFSFQIGDSIRVTAFLEGYYTYPHGIRISTSKTIIFDFLGSTADITGITDLYKNISHEDYTILNYDTIHGGTMLVLTSDTIRLIPGDIITLDLDSTGLIQKVVNLNYSSGNIIVVTEPAYMDDLFVNTAFNLNTKLIEPQTLLKSTSSPNDIMKAFTDKDGYIHPVKIIYYDKLNERKVKNALYSNMNLDASINIIDFYKDFSKTDLYGKKEDNVHFYIDEGFASLTSDAVFEFDFRNNGKLTSDTKVKKGDLNYFRFYLDNKADFQTKLALDMNYATEGAGEKKLYNMNKATAQFIVPPGVPVWITFDCDIFGNYRFNADASLHADWGFESHHQLQAGGIYEKATDDFTPFSTYEPSNIVYPLNIEGEVNLSARMELYPRVDIKLYDIFGPYAEIVPFVQGNYNASLQSQITLNGNETFLAWNGEIDLGLDLRIGTELSFIGLFEKEFGPKTINCFNFPLWKSPVNLELLTDIPDKVESGSTIVLNVKVTDINNLAESLCPVYFTGNGAFSKQIPFTGNAGTATINWYVGETTGPKTFTATIYNADKSVIKTVSGTTNVVSSPADDIIFNPNLTYGSVSDIDGNTYKTIQIGDQTWMAENLKTTKYNNGGIIPNVTDGTSWSGSLTPAYCWFDNDEASYKYANGALYNWYAVNTGNLCPAGWDVPRDADWTALTGYLGGASVAGGKLKETDTTHWNSPNLGATNESGFTALPGGLRGKASSFLDNGIYGVWWSSTDTSGGKAFYRYMHNNYRGIYRATSGKSGGISVRCIKHIVDIPTLLTAEASNISTGSATCGGSITSDGGASITTKGVCWSTAQNPTLSGFKTNSGSGTGSFISYLTDLLPSTTYYVRAYAINSAGKTGYGQQIIFRTSNEDNGIIFNPNLTYGSVSDIDGNIYKTIKIGSQIWMAENLKTTKYNNGTAIPLETGSVSTPAYCWYSNDAGTYKSTYGALYNWYAVSTTTNGSKNVCPSGWHVPTDAEWTTLTDYLGGKLKETGTNHWNSPNTGATNETGFTALPGGYRTYYFGDYFEGVGDDGLWWSATEYPPYYAWSRGMHYNSAYISRSLKFNQTDYSFKEQSFSVRCVRD